MKRQKSVWDYCEDYRSLPRTDAIERMMWYKGSAVSAVGALIKEHE